MKNLFRFFIGLVLWFGTSVAFAEFNENNNALLFNLGFTRGGMAVGVDFEHGARKTYGLGGYFRMYPDNTSPVADGITTFGGFIRPHFNRQAWDFYVSPGFGLISYKPAAAGKSDETLFGPSFAIGLLYELNPKMSFGAEEMSIYSWFGEHDYRGPLDQSLLAKFRFIF